MGTGVPGLLLVDGVRISSGKVAAGTGGTDPVAVLPPPPADVEAVISIVDGAAGTTATAADSVPLATELLRLLADGDPDGPPQLSISRVARKIVQALRDRRSQVMHRPSRRGENVALISNAAHTPPLVERDVPSTRVLTDRPTLSTPVPHIPGVQPGPVETVIDKVIAAVAPAFTGPALGGDICPYPGLTSFDAASAHFFFGRERATADLLERLERRLDGSGPVVVVGASGSGKSSLLRAGLLPALANGAVPVSRGWPQALLTPNEHPSVELARAVAGAVGMPSLGAARLDVTADPGRFAALLTEILTVSGRGEARRDRRIVIVVDQFEETFTLCADETERAAFIGALCSASRGNDGHLPAVVVFGVRADFYGWCAAYPELVDALQTGQVVVGPMTADEVRAAVLRPATAVGLAVEPGLVDLILHDLGADRGTVADPGSLPLLAHALRATWAERDGGMLTVAGYLRIGGLQGAIAQTAEATFDAFDAAGQEAAWQLLMRMVKFGEGTEDTRRRVRRKDLLAELDHPPAAGVLDALVEARLVSVDADTVQLSHEALLRSWPRLREWVEIDRAGAVARQQLDEAAREWDERGRDPSYLFAGSRLAGVRAWAEPGGQRAELSPVGRDFLDGSVAHELAEQRATTRRTRRLRQLLAAVTALLIFATIAMVFAFQQQSSAEDARNRALSQRIAADVFLLRGSDPVLGAQLGLVAYRLSPTPEARGAVLSSFGSGFAPATRFAGGHSASVGTTAYSPDGRLIATGSDDSTAALWDATDPRRRTPIAVLRGYSAPVKAVTFQPGGTLLATGGDDGSVKLWDVADPTRPALRSTLPPASASVFGLSFTRDGRTMASGGYGNDVKLWDLSDPGQVRPLGTIGGHSDLVRAVAFSPDGQFVATGSNDGTAKLWDIADSRTPYFVSALAPTEGDQGQIHNLSFSSDGQSIVTGDVTGYARIFQLGDPRRPTLVTQIEEPDVQAVGFSPDNQVVVVATQYDIRLYNPLNSSNWITRYSQGFKAWAAAFSPDGRTIAVGANDGALRIWDVTGPLLVGHSDGFSSAAMRPHGRVMATGSYDTTARLWDVSDPYRSLPLAVLQGHTDAVTGTDFTPDGRRLVTASADGTIKLWDVSDVRNPVLQSTVDSGIGAVDSIAFSPTGDVLVSGGEEGRVRLWSTVDPTRPEPMGTFSGGPSAASVEVVAFSPDGRTIATTASGNFDRSVRLWNVADPRNPQQVGEVSGFKTGGIFSVDFSPDGQTLAAGGGDRTVTLWSIRDPAAPRLLATLTGHGGSVDSIVFSPNGRLVAAGGGDSTVRIWDITKIDSPTSFGRIEGSFAGFAQVLFTPDGEVITGSPYQSIAGYVWELDPDRIVNRVCAKVGDPLTRDEWQEYVPELPYNPPCD